MWMGTLSPTSVIVDLTGSDSGISMQLLKISLLIVPSIYSSYVLIDESGGCIFGAGCVSEAVLNASTTVSVVNAYSTPLTAASSYQILGFINGLNIRTTYHPSTILGLSMSVMMINNTHYSLSFTSISSN